MGILRLLKNTQSVVGKSRLGIDSSMGERIMVCAKGMYRLEVFMRKDNEKTECIPSPVCTIAEVERMTTLSRRTITRMAERGEIRAVRVGRRWLIARASVDEMLAPVL